MLSAYFTDPAEWAIMLMGCIYLIITTNNNDTEIVYKNNKKPQQMLEKINNQTSKIGFNFNINPGRVPKGGVLVV